MARKIYAPGIEINEIDRSGYSQTSDESLTDTATLLMGFADKGIDYKTNLINNINTFIQLYGYPTTEAERYFYHGAKEVLENRGMLYCAKLPYYNDAKDKFSYTTYYVDPNSYTTLKAPYESMMEELPYINANDKDHITIFNVNDSTKNSFFDILTLYSNLSAGVKGGTSIKDKYLPFNFLSVINDEYLDEDSGTTYEFIDDFINYIYIQSELDISYREKFFYFFDNFKGLYLLKAFLSENGLTWLKYWYNKDSLTDSERELLGFNEISDYETYLPFISVESLEDFNDLKEIRKTLLDNYDGGYSEVLIKFAKQLSVNDYKSYYNSLYSILNPAINEDYDTAELSGFNDMMNVDPEDDNTLHKFKLYFNNLQYFATTDFYEEYEEQIQEFFESTDNSLKKYFSEIENLDTKSDWCKFTYRYGDIKAIDDTLTSFIEIKSLDSNSSKNSGTITLEDLDRLRTYQKKTPTNTFQIIDISKTKYAKDSDNEKECVGILPVVTTAANAIYFKELEKDESSTAAYNILSKIQTVYNKNVSEEKRSLSADEFYSKTNNLYLFDTGLSCETDKSGYADKALAYFPDITYTASQRVDKNYLKQIGIVVFKMTQSQESGKRINLTPVESFVGSLDRYGKDLNSNYNNFIDDVVNENSNYINLFSNINFTTVDSDIPQSYITNCSMFMIHNQVATSLGYYENQTLKRIKVAESIIKPIQRIFDNNKNLDEISLDLIVDAGVSTIAQFIESTTQNDNNIGYYDISDIESKNFNIIYSNGKRSPLNAWRQIAQLYDNFCKNVRKDCMFLMDAVRCTCVDGNQKVVRSTNFSNTIDNQILPRLKSQLNLNTSYGAGYSDWLYAYDEYSNSFFWMPPSIKVAGKIIYNDIYFNYYDPPAGLNRGVLDNIIDVAFSPTIDEAGRIYNYSWNYAVNYPMEGPVIEGQKTFQLESTAFDRINVRRLFLKLEKYTYRISKYFVYEKNTEFTRNRFVDTITPMFEDAKNGGGIAEYVIICNDKNNTVQTIENHELHCTIAIRPVKSIEFIVLNFIALPQSGSFTEDQLLEIANTNYTNT